MSLSWYARSLQRTDRAERKGAAVLRRRVIQHELEDWIVRAVNVTPYDLVHLRGRATTMEELWTEFKSM